MRAVIVDDEDPARAALRRRLEPFLDVQIVAEAANGQQAIEAIESHSPDVVFLDIEMPGLNGFDVLAELATPPAAVFVTAYDQYAVRAFETNAVDYLLKPVDAFALDRAVNRLRSRTATQPLSQTLLQELRTALYAKTPAKLAGRRGKKIILVPRRDILHIAAEDRLVFLCTATERFLTNRTMAELETLLPGSEFFRVNRGSLVSLEAVHEIYPWMTSGTWRVRLTNGTEIDVSRDRVQALRATVGF